MVYMSLVKACHRRNWDLHQLSKIILVQSFHNYPCIYFHTKRNNNIDYHTITENIKFTIIL